MKKVILGVFVFMVAVSLSGCGNSTKKMTQDELAQKMIKIGKQVDSGELSEAKGMKMMGELSKNVETEKTGMDALKEQRDNVADFSGIPAWAKKLGAIEPKGLTLIPGRSSVTAEDVEKHMNEDFSAYYTGDPEVVMSEAKRLVKALGGKITSEESDYLLANGDLPGNHSLSISVRTDVDKPFLSYSIMGRKKF